MKAMLLASAALIAASPATAATISVFGFAEYGIEASFLGSSSDSLIGDTTVDTTAGSVSHGETLDTGDSIPPFYFEDNVDWAQGASASAHTQMSADATTGALRLNTSQSSGLSGGGEVPPVSSASAYTYTEGRVSLSETFTVSGSGTLWAFLNIDSTVNLARSMQGWSGFGANTSIGIESGGTVLASQSENLDYGSCVDQDGDGGCDTLTGSVQKTSKASAAISGVNELTLTAVISSGDYAQGNTSLWAYLAILTTGNLKLVPSDSRFLSAPLYTPTAIPVPAGLPLVASGIALLGWLGRKRRA